MSGIPCGDARGSPGVTRDGEFPRSQCQGVLDQLAMLCDQLGDLPPQGVWIRPTDGATASRVVPQHITYLAPAQYLSVNFFFSHLLVLFPYFFYHLF